MGREAIISKLQSVAQMHSGFKVEHEVEDVQCQPLGFVSGTGGEGGPGKRGAAARQGRAKAALLKTFPMTSMLRVMAVVAGA